MKLVKHAKNIEVAECIILQCPYCDYKLPNCTINYPKIITHIRCVHIKNQFPPETIFTKLPKYDFEPKCKHCGNSLEDHKMGGKSDVPYCYKYEEDKQ